MMIHKHFEGADDAISRLSVSLRGVELTSLAIVDFKSNVGGIHDGTVLSHQHHDAVSNQSTRLRKLQLCMKGESRRGYDFQGNERQGWQWELTSNSSPSRLACCTRLIGFALEDGDARRSCVGLVETAIGATGKNAGDLGVADDGGDDAERDDGNP